MDNVKIPHIGEKDLKKMMKHSMHTFILKQHMHKMNTSSPVYDRKHCRNVHCVCLDSRAFPEDKLAALKLGEYHNNRISSIRREFTYTG